MPCSVFLSPPSYKFKRLQRAGGDLTTGTEKVKKFGLKFSESVWPQWLEGSGHPSPRGDFPGVCQVGFFQAFELTTF